MLLNACLGHRPIVERMFIIQMSAESKETQSPPTLRWSRTWENPPMTRRACRNSATGSSCVETTDSTLGPVEQRDWDWCSWPWAWSVALLPRNCSRRWCSNLIEKQEGFLSTAVVAISFSQAWTNVRTKRSRKLDECTQKKWCAALCSLLAETTNR